MIKEYVKPFRRALAYKLYNRQTKKPLKFKSDFQRSIQRHELLK